MTSRAGGTSSAPYASMNVGSAVGDDAEAVAANRRHLAEADRRGAGVPAPGARGAGRPRRQRRRRRRRTDPRGRRLRHDRSRRRLRRPGRRLPAGAARRARRARGRRRARRLARSRRRRRRGRGRGGERRRALRAGRDLPPGSAPASGRRGSRSAATSSPLSAPIPAPPAARRRRVSSRAAAASGWPTCPGWRATGSLPPAFDGSTGGDWCTVSDSSRFFSFRRDGVTGRMAAAIWIGPRLTPVRAVGGREHRRLHGCPRAPGDADHDNAGDGKSKGSDAGQRRRATAPQANRNAAQMMLAPDLGQVWQSMAGVGLPAEALAAPSASTSRRPERSGTGSWRPRRRASPTGASPAPTGAPTRRRRSSPSSTCSTRARCCTWPRASMAMPRPRRGSASRCCNGSTPRRRATTSRSIPKRSRRRSRPRARA